MKTRVLLGLLVLAIAVAAVWILQFAPPPKSPADLPSPTTRKMAARLEKIVREWGKQKFVKEENRLFRANRPQWIPGLRSSLQSSSNPADVFMYTHTLGMELLWDGQSREAFEYLLRSYRMAEALPPDRKQHYLTIIRKGGITALLRQGEEENCIAAHNPESCIFPVRGRGVHKKKEAAHSVVKTLLESLEANPRDLGARWLLNLACMTVGDYPEKVPAPWLIPEKVFASEYDIGRFVDVASRRGVAAMGLAGGCCVEDFDRDGDLDIMASSWGLRDQLRYFEQERDGSFNERTKEAGLLGLVGGLNTSHADYDNDGHVDVLVLRGAWLGKNGDHPNSLLRNLEGKGFDDVTEVAGVLTLRPTHTGVWGDYDNDGFLDLFVGGEQEPENMAAHSQLFHNNGDGTFSDCAEGSGLADLSFVKGAAWGDYDNDGFLDLYVSRIYELNLLFRNGGAAVEQTPERESGAQSWKFTDVTAAAGVGEPRFSFPTWFWDYDNDGWLDLFAAGYDGKSIDRVAGDYLGTPHRPGHPRLYRNLGDGTFRDVTEEMRLDRVLLAMGANFGDLDNDGWLDLYIGTGAPSLRALVPNRMFRNAGGKVFQDVTTAGGFGHLQKGHGIAFADIDGDGDQDVYAVMGGWYTGDRFQNVLFENPGHGNHWLTLRLEGKRSNRSAIGARVRITVKTPEGNREIHRCVGTGGSFGSTSLQQEVGLGNAVAVEEIEIRWPGGAVQVLRDGEMDRIEMDRVLTVREE